MGSLRIADVMLLDAVVVAVVVDSSAAWADALRLLMDVEVSIEEHVEWTEEARSFLILRLVTFSAIARPVGGETDVEWRCVRIMLLRWDVMLGVLWSVILSGLDGSSFRTASEVDRSVSLCRFNSKPSHCLLNR